MHQVEGSCHDLVGSCLERHTKKRKHKIRTQKKFREKSLPLDYAKTIFCIFQNLQENLSTMEELMGMFYQLSIHVDHQETDKQLAARDMNCLKFSIQDELSMHRVHSVGESYQLALKAQEKKNQQFTQRNRGARRGTSSTSCGSFNFIKGKSSQGAKKAEDT